jgi:hypothetical protein
VGTVLRDYFVMVPNVCQTAVQRTL